MDFRKSWSVFASALTLCLFAGSAGATAYNFVTLSIPGFPQGGAWGVNNLGQVVVQGVDATGTTGQSYLWQAGVATPIIAPPGAYDFSTIGISDGGALIGDYRTDAPVYDAAGNQTNLTPNHGYIQDGGTFLTLDRPGASGTFLRGISPDGRYVTGYTYGITGDMSGFAFDRSTGNFTSLDNSASIRNLPQGITNSGTVVGSETLRPAGSQAQRFGFVLDLNTGARIDIAVPGALNTSFRALDARGRVAGWMSDSAGLSHGLYGTTTDYSLIDFPGAPYTVIEGTNDAGVLTGTYTLTNRGPSFAFLAIPVPEPASAALALVGLTALLARRRQARPA
jgi:MYXO-CTERM domain-containing protein